MKKALLKDTLKEIVNTRRKFISILIMAFLGVGFFCGIRASSPDMKATVDKYYDKQNLYDIKVMSTLGLTNDDILAVKNIDNVENAYGLYSMDVTVITKQESICKIYSINQNVNTIKLLSGDMPKNDNECLVEEKFLTLNSLNIGDYFEINTSEKDFFKNTTLKIVGTAESPLYISRDRGTTNLGSGTIDYYAFVPESNVKSEVYTEIYLHVNNAKELNTCSDEYKDYINKIDEKIENIKQDCENRRYNEILGEAQNKINDAKSELEEKKNEGQKELTNAKNELATANNKIQSGKNEIANSKLIANEEFNLAQKKIDDAKTELQNQKSTFENNKNYLEETVIEETEYKINIMEQQIAKSQEELNNKIETTNQEFQKAEDEIKASESKYNDGLKRYSESKTEYDKKISEAENEISSAEEDLSKIEKAKWYIFDRYDNSGFSGFIQDSDSVGNIGKVFPVIFFVIAILISLTTMTRMVEEERMEIGTLKTLGYSKLQISLKYIVYASLATLIGGLIGLIIGFNFLPRVIWMMYNMMYSLKDFVVEYNFVYAIIGVFSIFVCIIGATIYSISKELRQMPAVLLRPKSPKIGKRVLLEKVTFIWKRLNFIQKVTVRNMFRYKKRFLLTVIGILGCTSLTLTGFGIKDSVTSLIPDQYINIFYYDTMITLKDGITEEETSSYVNNLNEKNEIKDTVETHMTSLTLSNDNLNEEIQLIVPKNKEELSKAINIISLKDNEKKELPEDTVFLTDKVAELIGTKIGDTVILQDADGNKVEVGVGDVVENYLSHYVYMSKSLYEKLYGKYSTNVILTTNNNLTKEEENVLVSEIIEDENTFSVMATSYIKGLMDDTLKSLDYVVLVLIVSSGLLAFVVLYNLANVNISERIRELATIKVLGFYDKEVYQYLNRETIILTILGIILGLISGYFLSGFIMSTCEINILRFSKVIKPLSYVYSAGITLLFTGIVNIFIYKTLKKIDMIESLKSVE